MKSENHCLNKRAQLGLGRDDMANHNSKESPEENRVTRQSIYNFRLD